MRGSEWHPGELYVVDANGKRVGPLATMNYSVGSTVEVDGVIAFAPIERAFDVRPNFSASRYKWSSLRPKFPSTDCTGPPVIDTFSLVLRPSELVPNGNETTLYIAPDRISISIQERSVKQLVGGSYDKEQMRWDGWLLENSFPLSRTFPEPLTIHY